MVKVLIEYIAEIEDERQQGKVKYPLEEIIVIVLFAMLGNANEWEEIEGFAKIHEKALKKYLSLKNGIPSHDTIRRVMGMISAESLQNLQNHWNELLSSNEGEKLRKIINIDGKTMCDSGNKDHKAHHIVSAWSKSDGFCLGQTAVDEKSNEITAIPVLLKKLAIKGHIVTIDAIGTQIEIAKQIKEQKGDYVLALKRNQTNLWEDVKEYFAEPKCLTEIKQLGNYKRTVEKARSGIEVREYYQTSDIAWISSKGNWKGLKTIGMIETTIEKNGKKTSDRRFYITSLSCDIELLAKAIRGHWAIESMHWHLDVTFGEDFNTTINKTAALNMNIMRKFCLSILKLIEVRKKKTSLKLKRFLICCEPAKYLDQILSV